MGDPLVTAMADSWGAGLRELTDHLAARTHAGVTLAQRVTELEAENASLRADVATERAAAGLLNMLLDAYAIDAPHETPEELAATIRRLVLAIDAHERGVLGAGGDSYAVEAADVRLWALRAEFPLITPVPESDPED